MPGRTDSGGRLLLLLIVFVLGAGALVTRLGYWQLVKHDDLVESAHRQIYYRAEVPSQRGQIYDRSGTIVLAASVTRDRLIVNAEELSAEQRATTTRTASPCWRRNARSSRVCPGATSGSRSTRACSWRSSRRSWRRESRTMPRPSRQWSWIPRTARSTPRRPIRPTTPTGTRRS